MADLANELNSLDFGTLIGGPLQAAITAQNDAALAQVDTSAILHPAEDFVIGTAI